MKTFSYANMQSSHLFSMVEKTLAINTIAPFSEISLKKDGSIIGSLYSENNLLQLSAKINGPSGFFELSEGNKIHNFEIDPSKSNLGLNPKDIEILKSVFQSKHGRIDYDVTADKFNNSISYMYLINGSKLKIIHPPFTPRGDDLNVDVRRFRIVSDKQYINATYIGNQTENPKSPCTLNCGPIKIHWSHDILKDVYTFSLDESANDILPELDRSALEIPNLENALCAITFALQNRPEFWTAR